MFEAFERIELADWEAVMAHGFPHDDFERWLQAETPQARFYDASRARPAPGPAERRGERWHSADALAMALALQPDGALEMADRPLAIELQAA